MTEGRHEVRRQGLGVSPGIAFGRAYLIGRDTLKAPRHHIEPDDVDTEVARLYKAIAASDKQLAKIKEKLASENESDYHIITAHQMMLHDEHLVGAAVGYIRDNLINAEWGLRRSRRYSSCMRSNTPAMSSTARRRPHSALISSSRM